MRAGQKISERRSENPQAFPPNVTTEKPRLLVGHGRSQYPCTEAHRGAEKTEKKAIVKEKRGTLLEMMSGKPAQSGNGTKKKRRLPEQKKAGKGYHMKSDRRRTLGE